MRWLKWIAATLAIVAVLVFAGFHFAVAKLKSSVEAALGSDSEIASIDVGWHAVVVNGLRIHGPNGWPVPDTLRAERIVIEPQLDSLLSGGIAISRITVDGAYLSIWRAPNGKLRLLPSLLEKQPDAPQQSTQPATGKPALQVALKEIVLGNAGIDFIDSSLPHSQVKLGMTAIDATVRNIALPGLAEQSSLHLNGKVKGSRQDGTIIIDGNSTLANKDTDVTLTLQSVDLLPLAPYLIKASDTGIRQGSLDLKLHSVVQHNHLHAPGEIVLHQLELNGHGFMGVSQTAAVALLKDGNDAITAHFTLDGNLDDPHFSLNENLLHRASAGIAEAMGVSVQGLAHQLGSTAEGIGSKLKGLWSH